MLEKLFTTHSLSRGGVLQPRLLLLSLLLLLALPLKAQTKNSLLIRVLEYGTEEPIPGALVLMEKQQLVTNLDGEARLLPPAGKKAELQVRMVGYKDFKTTIKRGAEEVIVAMQSISLGQVTVTSERRSPSTTVSVRMGEKALQAEVANSLAKVLQEVPGLSSISSGATIMKPVIQGMHSSRILLINNGVRQEGQQWGADHAPEVDISTATSMEVIKGAESIRYGSGAIGGVILLQTAALPEVGAPIKGHVATHHSSNDLGFGANGDLSGTVGSWDWLRWRTQAAYTIKRDYQTPNYMLYNTGVREGSFTGVIGIERPRFSVDFFTSYYHTLLGIFTGAHIGNLEDLFERFEKGYPEYSEEISPTYKIVNPKQAVDHLLSRLSGEYRFANDLFGHIKAQYDFQYDNRREYEIRVTNQDLPSLGLLLASHSAQGVWETNKEVPLRFIVGGSAQYQKNTSDFTRSVPLIPNFASYTNGIYGIVKYVQPIYELEAGARHDYKYLNAVGFDVQGKKYGGEREYRSPSFSFSGLVRPLSGLTFATNLGLSWRSPDVNELFSNGLHHGAASYEEGNSDLESERSWKWNNELRYANSWINASVTGFYQVIGNYIYAAPQKDPVTKLPLVKMLIAGAFPIFKYQQADARFYGGDLTVRVKPIEQLEYTVQGQWIRATNTQTGGFFPYIPSDRYMQALEWSSGDLLKKHEFTAGVDHTFVTKQTRFSEDIDFLPETPDAYNLFGASLSYVYNANNGNQLRASVKADNLFNALYKEYTNRFRYFTHERGRDIQFVLGYYF